MLMTDNWLSAQVSFAKPGLYRSDRLAAQARSGKEQLEMRLGNLSANADVCLKPCKRFSRPRGRWSLKQASRTL